MALLSEDEIAAGLPGGWSREGDEIVRAFEFESYARGALFTAAVALLAEEADHHPDLLLTYRRVEVRLSSHDAGGVTDRDLRLARKISELFIG